jgi:hypothetical protein
MQERLSQPYPHRPNIDALEEEINGPRYASYQFGRSTNTDPHSDDSMPIFLSSQDDDPERQAFEDSWEGDYQPSRRGTSRILMGFIAASALAIVAGLFSVDTTRAVIMNATASIAGALPIQPATAKPESAQLTANDLLLKDPTRLSAPAAQAAAQPTANARRVAVAPTREEIAAAYQSALQERAPAPATPAVATPVAAAPAVAAPVAVPQAVVPPPRHLDAEEAANLMNRAKSLIAIGDIPPARLLLQRAADAQAAGAALLLAQTYDPAVLGTPDARSIIADPAAARSWYLKAAQLGSREAQQRLAQIQN